jgi:hypothetical protein
MSKLLTLGRANALLPLISKIELTLSELGYHIGIVLPQGNFLPTERRGSTFDEVSLHKDEVAPILNVLWDDANNLCNGIAKALESDGPNLEYKSSYTPPQNTRSVGAPQASEPSLESL